APQSLDPHHISTPAEHRIVMGLFEGLVAPDPETARATPGVAERWEISDDGLEYTFHLRDDAVWSDGTPITAHDFVESWMRVLNPRTAAPSAWFAAQFIAGAQAFYRGEVGADAVAIRAVDDRTFQFETVRPTPYVLDTLSHYAFQVVPLHAIEEYGDQWTMPENFVGNGPYTVTAWDPRGRVVLEPNDTYWNAPSVQLDRVVFSPVENHVAAFDRYTDGAIHWLPTVPGGRISEAEGRADYHVSPDMGTSYYVLNSEREPLNDPAVRTALGAAIDRQLMVETVNGVGEIPAYSLVPPMPGYPGIEGLHHDRAAAQELLASAGYPGGEGFPELTVLHNASDEHRSLAEFIQHQWRTNLGITVRLESRPWESFVSRTRRGEFDVARAGWIGTYQDPTAFLDMFIAGGDLNYGRFSDERYTRRIAEAREMMSGEARFAALQQAEHILVEEQTAVIPLYHYTNRNMIDVTEWGGWFANGMGWHPVGAIFAY
ncbi:MAG TPA: peptide ABC transporter substrate-binding protein, partial [Alkalispirochaeta sp.]|nr:peptide ABC transporter substrate-binding protein [Alkalispirochaeta sp.]